MKRITYEWIARSIRPCDVEAALNDLEIRGYEITNIVPQEKNDTTGIPTIFIVAKRVMEYAETAKDE